MAGILKVCGGAPGARADVEDATDRVVAGEAGGRGPIAGLGEIAGRIGCHEVSVGAFDHLVGNTWRAVGGVAFLQNLAEGVTDPQLLGVDPVVAHSETMTFPYNPVKRI
ncbi:MAG: hypothetical protein ACRDZ8_11035 [Acidimicrobiales bacterium]